jgi:glutathione S-transferase
LPILLLKLVFIRMSQGPVPALPRPVIRMITARVQKTFIDPQLVTHIRHWDDELRKEQWFAGAEFTAADIQMSFPLEAAAARSGVALGEGVKSFLERIHSRPAYQRARPAGGEYQLAR